MRVLVLGGYGLIGREIVRKLQADGASVVGLGRSLDAGLRVGPTARWIAADMSKLIEPNDWAPHLAGMDAVVNASGALQDGLRDKLSLVQSDAICALVSACERSGVRRFVQISAPGAAEDASTAFLRTKAVADAALRNSNLDWVIFKPGLVISAYAYGGTSLLRQLAAFPFVQPLILAERRLQIVAASDVADAVSVALDEGAPLRRDFDLLHPEPHTLRALVAAFRAWLGFRPARGVVALPNALGFAVGRLADVAGWVGWRSPLRTTALRVLDREVLGDGSAWIVATGRKFKSLTETLAALPATAQERRYARTQLAFPVLLFALSAFWIVSGLIGLARLDQGANVLAGTSLAPFSKILVAAGACVDVAVGVALCVRGLFLPALKASIVVSVGYLALASIWTPALWLDPLGPLVKIFPAIALALAVAAMDQDR